MMQSQRVSLVNTSRREKIIHYPYYPVTCSRIHNNVGYLFSVQTNAEQPHMLISAFNPSQVDKMKKQDELTSSMFRYSERDRISAFDFVMKNLPNRMINCLQILKFDGGFNVSQADVVVQSVEFILGFSYGYLVRAQYQNKRKSFTISQMFNESPNPQDSYLYRLSSKLFSSDTWYNLDVKKPVLAFQVHTGSNNQIYSYSYHIGNRLFLGQALNTKINREHQTIKIYRSIQWDLVPASGRVRLGKNQGIVSQTSKHRALTTSASILIDWEAQVSSYVYMGLYRLLIANNTQNKLIMYNLETMERVMVYRVGWEIKRIKLSHYSPLEQGKLHQLVLIMPYENFVCILDLNSNCTASLNGHKSFITNASVTSETEVLVTGGCDQRIGLKKISQINKWVKSQKWVLLEDPNNMSKLRREIEVEESPATQIFKIDSSPGEQEFGEIYASGEFDNKNRNNTHEYGFGNFFPLGSQLYAFVTYDFLVKVYKLVV